MPATLGTAATTATVSFDPESCCLAPLSAGACSGVFFRAQLGTTRIVCLVTADVLTTCLAAPDKEEPNNPDDLLRTFRRHRVFLEAKVRERIEAGDLKPYEPCPAYKQVTLTTANFEGQGVLPVHA